MIERLRSLSKINLGQLLRIDPQRQTLLPCLMILTVVVNKSISMDIVGILMLSYLIQALVLLSFVFMSYLFATLWTISTIVNANDVKKCFYDSCSLIFIAMACDYYKKRFYMLIASFAIAFSVCAYLNFLHMLAHPELWIVEDLKTNQGYLLGGNYNGMGCRLLCAVGTSVTCLKYSKWWLINAIPVTLVSIATLVIVSSMTSLFLFQFFVCFQGKGIEQNPLAVYIVEDVFGKDITFTYRTYLWDSAATIFVNSPFYGYGNVDRDWYYSHMSAIAMGTHNYIWGVLVTGGILLLSIFSYISFLSYSKLFSTTERYALQLYAAATVLFLMMLMENYPHMFIFTLLLLPAFAPRTNKI